MVLKSVSERYKKLNRWEANFSQEVLSVGLGGKGSFSTGRFVFEAPNRFRYSILSPEASDFISNGKKAWYILYREGREKPAYVRVADKLSQIELDRYLIVLRGIQVLNPAQEKKLLKDFKVNGKSTPTEITLDLEPKNSAEVQKISLIFKNDQPVLHKAVITDTLGTQTTITVSDHKLLKKVDPKEFQADYPKDSKVESF